MCLQNCLNTNYHVKTRRRSFDLIKNNKRNNQKNNTNTKNPYTPTLKVVILCVICRQASCQVFLYMPKTMVIFGQFLIYNPLVCMKQWCSAIFKSRWSQENLNTSPLTAHDLWGEHYSSLSLPYKKQTLKKEKKIQHNTEKRCRIQETLYRSLHNDKTLPRSIWNLPWTTFCSW